MRTRKPKPTALKILEGAQPCRINKQEPASPPGAAPCPDHLQGVARETWFRISKLLDDMTVLTHADSESVALYCSTFARWLQAEAAIDEHGLLIPGATGGLKQNPAIGIADGCKKTLIRLQGEFGFTPSARSALHLKEAVKEDPLAQFLAMSRADATG